MGKDTFRYIGLCMALYLTMAAIEYFLMGPLADFISQDYRVHLIAYLLCLLLINPALTRSIADRFSKYGDRI